jgi:hypothetical protein
VAATRLVLPDVPARPYSHVAWCPTGKHHHLVDGRKGIRNRPGYCSGCFPRWWASTMPARLAQGGVRLPFQLTSIPPVPLS